RNGQDSISRRPGGGRDPGKAARRACESLDSGLRRSDEDVIVLPWMWRRSTFFVVPAPGRDPDTRPARHAREAWAPASAGATRMESRCLGSGDTQHSSSSRRQAGIQTQDRRAMRAKPGLRPTPERRGWDRVALDVATLNIVRRPGARPGSRHKTGAPGARSLGSGLRRSDENEIALPWIWRRSTLFVVPA